jgi:hypothetical protein
MRMTLTYRGPLPPRQRGVSPVKAELRRAFHPQIHVQLAPRLGPDGAKRATTEVDGHAFVSAAHPDLGTVVELDVLLLTAPSRSRIGDLDNRLKALVDGLTRPANGQQMQDFRVPDEGGPTFCLMDDDRLVRQLRVDYRPWHERTGSPGEALVIVTAVLALDDSVSTSSRVADALLVL